MSRKPKGYYSGWTVDRFKEEVEKIDAESRSDLRRKDNSLYKHALKRDGWLDGVFGNPLHRDFSDWNIDNFKKKVEELGAKSRRDLAKKDSGLYYFALRQVGWLDNVFGPSMTGHHRDYSDWTVERFKKEVEILEVASRNELNKKDPGLYKHAGKQDGWLDAAFGDSQIRNFSGLSLEQFKDEVKKLGAESRGDLRKKDKGLYKYANKREWLGPVFGSRGYWGLSLENFIRVVEEFGYASRWELGKKDHRLYEYALKQDGWLDAAFGPIKGKYSGLTLENFVRIVEEFEYCSKSDLRNKDCGLYAYAVKKNGWLDAAFSDNSRYDFSGWDLERVKKEVEELGVKSRTDLNKKASGLYSFANSQGWLGVIFGSKGYSGLSFENFIRIVEELGHTSRVDLQKNEHGLYAYAAKQNGWLDAAFGDPLRRDFSNWSLELFRKEVAELGVRSRKGLQKKDSTLYRHACKKPGWLDSAFGPIKGKYAGLTLENFVRIVEEFEYTSRSDLSKKDRGLYVYVRKQDGWLDAAFGFPLNRDYSSWTVERFKEEVKKIGAESRKDLGKKDQGLYVYARRQDGWLDAVFGYSKNEHYKDYKDWTIEHCHSEMEKAGIESRSELEKRAPGLYKYIRKHGWLGAIFGSKGYSGLSFENFVTIVEELEYVSRSDLQKKEIGLYQYARKKGWLDVVFQKSSSSIDSVLESYVNQDNNE